MFRKHRILSFHSNVKEKKESEQHGIRTAEKLLKEFYPHSQEGQNQVEMLQSYCLMATKEKHNVEKALKVFIEMGQNEVNKRNYLKFKMIHISRNFVKASECPYQLTLLKSLDFFFIVVSVEVEIQVSLSNDVYYLTLY